MITFGVEEEFMVVDRHGRLSNASAAVLADAPPADGELQPELVRCQVESATPVCSTADELLGHLRTQRDQLAKAAGRHDLRLLPAGTAPQPDTWQTAVTADRRYERMATHFGTLIDSANICGCHVHIGIPDRASGVRVSNYLRPWLPVLLAVSANSPFAAGRDTGHASWRHQTIAMWPTAGPPPHFDSPDHYDATVQALLGTGAIVDEQMIYWDIRLSPRHPTVEIRVCDVAPTAPDATLLAVLTRALAATALQQRADAPPVPTETIAAALWRAGKDGLEGLCPDPFAERLMPATVALQRLVDHVREEFAPGEDEFVDRRVTALKSVPGGAFRQRAVFARRRRIRDVIDLLAEQF
ncbi:glutamate--cysteine ligase [Actinocrispum sp. NPDC049592]|uniref:carboxylate-amine ligase n=1 Tax=Actinocrispum sp. NPDC049592 TaxID=3154835 RepID=UPI0034244B26